MRKLQEQNESNQAGRAKMAEGLTLALEKRDQVWTPFHSIRKSVIDMENEKLDYK